MPRRQKLRPWRRPWTRRRPRSSRRKTIGAVRSDGTLRDGPKSGTWKRKRRRSAQRLRTVHRKKLGSCGARAFAGQPTVVYKGVHKCRPAGASVLWRTLITLLIRGAARMCSAGPKTQSKCPEDTHLKRAVFHSTSTAKRHWTPPPAGSDDLLAQAQRLRKDVRAFLEDALLEQTPASFEAAARARAGSSPAHTTLE